MKTQCELCGREFESVIAENWMVRWRHCDDCRTIVAKLWEDGRLKDMPCGHKKKRPKPKR